MVTFKAIAKLPYYIHQNFNVLYKAEAWWYMLVISIFEFPIIKDFYRMNNLPVYHVQHINLLQGSTFFLPNSVGVNIQQSVSPQASEKVFIKHTPNAFLSTGLADELFQNGINHIVICGMMSHMCIDTTVRAAHDLGFSVTVLEDACTTKDLFWDGILIPATIVQNTFMASLNGIFAQVLQTDKFLENTKHFKQ